MATREEEQRINTGLFGGSRVVEPSQRGPSLATRAFRGDFQMGRQATTPVRPINTGLGTREPAASAVAQPAVSAPAAAPRGAPGGGGGGHRRDPNPRLVAPSRPAVAPQDPAAVVEAKQPAVGGSSFTFSDGRTIAVNPAAAPATSQPQSVVQPGRVASTFGQSVLSMPDDAASPVARPSGAFTGPRAMAEQYSSREDRDAARALASNIETDIFRLGLAAGRRGREGRQAQSSIAALRGTQAELVGGAAQRNAGQMDRRSVSAAELTGKQMALQGDMHRAALDASTRTNIAQMQDATARSEIEATVHRPTLQTDASGNLVSVQGTQATPVVGADGATVRMPQTVAGQITPAALLDAYTAQAQAIGEGLGTPEEKAQQQAALRGDPLFASLFQRDAPQAPRPPANAAAFVKEMRARGSKMTDQQLNAYFNQNYGK